MRWMIPKPASSACFSKRRAPFPRLRDALLRAAEQDVPVVILTVGGSPRGRAMVAAHSGALAGERAAWDAFCAATGAVHVSDLAEFSDTIELFSAGRRARPGGIATVHDSGAERALVADLAHELGVEFADLAPDTLAAIGGMLDDGLAATNPLDVWGTGADTRNLFGACLRAMVDDPAVAVTALAVDLVTEFDGDTAYADAVTDVAKHTDAPIAVMASVAVGDRPDHRGTIARQRNSGAGRRPQRAGGAGPPRALAVARRPRRARNGSRPAGALGQSTGYRHGTVRAAGRLRRACCGCRERPTRWASCSRPQMPSGIPLS